MTTDLKWKWIGVEDVGHAGRSVVSGKSRTVNGQKKTFKVGPMSA